MTITESTDDQLMAMAAFRYCLGRQSYIVGSCLGWLRAHWGQLTPNTRNVILRDTVEALMDGRAGSEAIDAPGWRDFLRWAWDRADAESREWVLRATAHKPGKWPLAWEDGR